MDKKQQGKSNREWGAEAEKIAADWLLTQGYVIRHQNWRIKNTIEIDIIAELPGTIVFVEVKARKGDIISPIDAIDEKKIRKIVRGANVYLQNLDQLFKYRFDIITITGTPENHTLEHFPDAFYPPFGRY
ncbi:MAG: YraN family protein [Muribaculaceae bacterium]|nr:YraN family protein [Muribaculaceae bacterium]